MKEEKARRAQDDVRKLNHEARRIAEMINRDFQDFSDRIARVKARSGTGHDLGKSTGKPGGADNEVLVTGESVSASHDEPQTRMGNGGGSGGNGRDVPDKGPNVRPDQNGTLRGDPVGGEGKAKRPRGGFSVEFKEMGADSPRASYVSAERTIYVNLEHPQIHTAKGTGSVEDPIFRRLAYEVVFSEYAIALAHEMDHNGEFIEPSEALVEVRDTLNRMARRAAALYAS